MSREQGASQRSAHADDNATAERWGNGRRKEPLGIRAGGAHWNADHEAIARNALVLLVDRGFYKGLRQDAAGPVTTRTVYRHFADATALAVAAIEQLPSGSDWIQPGGREELHAALRSAFASSAPIAAVHAVVLSHRRDAPELLAAFTDHYLRPRRTALEAWLRAGSSSGDIRPGVDVWIIEASIDGALMTVVTDPPGSRSATTRANAVTDAIWAAVTTTTCTRHS